MFTFSTTTDLYDVILINFGDIFALSMKHVHSKLRELTASNSNCVVFFRRFSLNTFPLNNI